MRIPWICGCAVPIFFFISGFLLAGSCEQPGWYGNALRKRVKTLLVPYVIICGCWFPVLYGLHEIAIKFAGANPDTLRLTWRTPLDVFGILFHGGPYSVGMWYIRALLILVAFSPVLVFFIRRSVLLCWMTVGVTMMLWIVSKYHVQLGIVYSEWWEYFFTFGVPCYGVACFTLGLATRLRGGGVMFLWRLVPSGAWPKWLVSNAFPLFVLHPMVIYLICYVLKGVHCLQLKENTVGYVVGLVVIIPGVCGFAQFVKMKFPRLASLVFGGR